MWPSLDPMDPGRSGPNPLVTVYRLEPEGRCLDPYLEKIKAGAWSEQQKQRGSPGQGLLATDGHDRTVREALGIGIPHSSKTPMMTNDGRTLAIPAYMAS
ncbi:hypothetical protein PG985_012339 [Apiospora marii]|uniref:Uncharacterized protein n=1 Tax=Apiospora marii TaxID=335849 RepID=A0ABR1RDJ8_9PEZI